MAARRTPLLTALVLALARPGWGLLLDGASLLQLGSRGPGDADIQELGAPLEIVPPVEAGDLATHDAEAGGPWLKTRKGEDFHVMRSGVFDFLAIPKNADEANQQFHMVGRITPLKRSEPCGSGALLTGLRMSGSWLGFFGSINFIADTAAFDTPDSIGIRIDNGYNISVAKLEEYRGIEGYPLKRVTRSHPAKPEGKRHADTLVVEFEFRTMSVTVGWAHSSKPTANWLWVDVSSLEGVAGPVGGILGEDSHKEVEQIDSTCHGDPEPRRAALLSPDLPTPPAAAAAPER